MPYLDFQFVRLLFFLLLLVRLRRRFFLLALVARLVPLLQDRLLCRRRLLMKKEIDFASKRVFPGRSNHLAFPPFAGGGVGLLGLLRSRRFLRRLVSALPSFTFFLASVLNSRERKSL